MMPLTQSRPQVAARELTAEFFEHVGSIGLPCRLVDADGSVAWQSAALQQLLNLPNGGECCADLGVKFREPDCISRRTIAELRPQHDVCWLGRRFVMLNTLPVRRRGDLNVSSFEIIRDCTAEKTLEAALAEQQEMLEAVNRAMIEINHDLETTQRELREKNDDLAAANEKLRSLDRLKDEFIGIVSHELKAPLTSIRGSVQLIQTCDGDRLSATGSELLAVCRRNIERLQRLIIDLLDITRIESGRLTLGISHFDLRTTVADCVTALLPLAERKKLTITIDIPDGLTMAADRDRLPQVLINLVNNAIKFTDQGEICITAEARDAEIVIEVQDTGIGIPPQDYERVFEKFAQVGTALQRNTEGTGLGLSIARSIIREHGGDITVTSAVGAGSRFRVVVPQPPRGAR